MHIFIKKKILIFNHYNVKCAIGKRGIGIKRKEGDLVTPKGVFKIIRVFYRKDKIRSLKTKIKKYSIKKDMGWCDDPRSEKYNKLVKLPFNFSAEKFYRRDNIYDIILVLNYNMHPTKKNKGSAIFIHIAKKNYSATKGCIAIKRNDIKKLASIINRKTLVKIL